MSGVSNSYVDEFQQLLFAYTGTALLFTAAGSGDSNLTVTGISLSGTNYTPVAAGTSPSANGFDNAATVSSSYLQFAVDSDGSIKITPLPDPQTVVDDINNNASSTTPLNDVLYYQVYDSSTGQTTTNMVQFDLNDIGFSNPNTVPYSSAELVTPDATVAVSGLSVQQAVSSNGSGSDPSLTVTVSLNGGGFANGSLSIDPSTASGSSTIDDQGSAVTLTGLQSDINTDLANLTYTAGGSGSDQLFLSVTDGPAQSRNYLIGSFETGGIHNTYDSAVTTANFGGTSGSLDGTEGSGFSGITVIGVSTDGTSFTSVPAGGNGTIDGTYESFTATADGQGSNAPVTDAQDIINAVNQNDLSGSGPLTDTFYYKVQDAAGNISVDEFTFTYGDVGANIPAPYAYGTTTDVTPGSTTSIAGITVQKAQSTDGNVVADDPHVAITLGLFANGSVNGTLSASTNVTGGGGTITYGTNSITIDGLQSQVNADLTTLTYTANTVGSDTLTESTTDESYVSGYTYQSATYIDGTFEVACYCRGTRILTACGEVAVEALRAGATVLTTDGTAEPVRWIGHRSYDGRFIAGNHLMLPVTIRASALADGVPRTDLTVSPGHAMWIDGQLVPAWRLINGTTITQADAVDEVQYFHVELHRHAVILANGAPAESFLDETGFRNQFANAADFHAGFPDAVPLEPMQARLEDGFALQRIQDRLAERAGLVPSIAPIGELRGFVDQATPDRVCGWAQDVDSPEQPVTLEVRAGGLPVMSMLANAYRADLRRAGMGSGCHAFDIALPPGLRGAVTVRRAADGMLLGMTDAAAKMEHRRAA